MIPTPDSALGASGGTGRTPPPSRRAARWWRYAGFAAVLFFGVLVGRFWHPVYGLTAFFQLDASNDNLKLKAFRELPVYVYRDTGGYDGLYYAQLALDPSLHDPQFPAAMDNFSYRARRILPSAFAWVLGAGRPGPIVAVYALVNVLAWLALALLLWRILAVSDLRSWLAWSGVLFSTGALCSVRLALTDLVATAFLAGALLAAEAGRKRTALGVLATAALARETALLGAAGLVKPPWLSLKNAVRLTLAVVPLAAWLLYVRWTVGTAAQGWGNFTWPLAGAVEKTDAVLEALASQPDRWLAWTTALATFALFAQAAYVVMHPQWRERWWRVAAAYVLLLAFLGTAVWEGFPGAATRVLLPLTLAFNVLACRARAALAWLIVGNLGIGAGLLALRDVPADPRELAAARQGNVACIARVADGWFPAEHTSRHSWRWTGHGGSFEVETWPRTTSTAQLRFGLRSLSPRVVVLKQDGREIWRTTVGTARTSHSVEVTVGGGRATFALETLSPPDREQVAENPRELAFAVYDVSIAIPSR